MIELANKIIEIISIEGQTQTLASATDSESKRIPFIHGFPTNSCEVISYLFAMIAKEVSPERSIEIVSGSIALDKHFWVTIDGLVYDLTAHQFTNVDYPKLGMITNDIPNLRIEYSRDVINHFRAWDMEHKNYWLDFVRDSLL